MTSALNRTVTPPARLMASEKSLLDLVSACSEGFSKLPHKRAVSLVIPEINIPFEQEGATEPQGAATGASRMRSEITARWPSDSITFRDEYGTDFREFAGECLQIGRQFGALSVKIVLGRIQVEAAPTADIEAVCGQFLDKLSVIRPGVSSPASFTLNGDYQRASQLALAVAGCCMSGVELSNDGYKYLILPGMDTSAVMSLFWNRPKGEVKVTA
jgi:hypothetical protein